MSWAQRILPRRPELAVRDPSGTGIDVVAVRVRRFGRIRSSPSLHALAGASRDG